MTCKLLRWKEKYIQELYSLANDPQIARWMDDRFPSPFIESDASAFINARLYADEQREYSRAIVVDERVCGCIHLEMGSGMFHRSASLSFWMGTEWQGRGIMTALLSNFCREAFNLLEADRICALTFFDNNRARCVLNTADFELEGIMKNAAIKDGIMHDLCIYALLRDNC